MDKKKNDDKIRIWQMFADFISNNVLDPDLRNIDNPIYFTLSKQLNKPRNEIRKIVLEMQPSLLVKKYKYVTNLSVVDQNTFSRVHFFFFSLDADENFSAPEARREQSQIESGMNSEMISIEQRMTSFVEIDDRSQTQW